MTLAQARVWARERTMHRATEAAILGFCGVKLEDLIRPSALSPHPSAGQGIGQFCGGTCIRECTQQFGDGLWRACRTCPN